jgi:hypothetical protein
MKFVADCEGMVGDTSPSRLAKKKKRGYTSCTILFPYTREVFYKAVSFAFVCGMGILRNGNIYM